MRNDLLSLLQGARQLARLAAFDQFVLHGSGYGSEMFEVKHSRDGVFP
jgi:hypothetical protein